MVIKANIFSQIIKTIRLIVVVLILSFDGISQSNIPKGKVQLIEFTNLNSSFTVPEGKYWMIYSIFSDPSTEGKIVYSENIKANRLDEEKVIRIYLKEMNGVEKTNYSKNIYGPQFYQSYNSNAMIVYPVLFPEKTSFKLSILKGNPGNLSEYNGKAYISFIEVDN
jgi:hypothetical protein